MARSRLGRRLEGTRRVIFRKVEVARLAQFKERGDQRHRDGTGGSFYRHKADAVRRQRLLAAADPDIGYLWALILEGQVYEALAQTDPDRLEAELVHVMAAASAWLEDLYRRPYDRDNTRPCAAPACRRRVPKGRVMCPRDWKRVPPEVQDRIYRHRPDGHGDPSPEYAAALADAARALEVTGA